MLCLIAGVPGGEVAPDAVGLPTGVVVQHQPGQIVTAADGTQVVSVHHQSSQVVLAVAADGVQQPPMVNIYLQNEAPQARPPLREIRPWHPGEVPPERQCPNCWLLPEVVCCACPCLACTAKFGFPDCLNSKSFCKILTCECLHTFVVEKRCTCCEVQEQCCCDDYRCACPPSPQIPCLCTWFPFCLCAPKCMCCATIHDVMELDKYPDRAYVMPGNVDLRHLYICSACCCCSDNCYCKCPDCICSESHYCACFCCRDEGYCKLFATDTDLKCIEIEQGCLCFKFYLSIPPDRNRIAFCAPLPWFVLTPQQSGGCCIKYRDGQPLCRNAQGDAQIDHNGMEVQVHQPQPQQAD